MSQTKRQRRKKKTKASFEKKRNRFLVYFGVGVVVSMALLVLVDRIRNGGVKEDEIKQTVFTFEEDLQQRDYIELSEMLYHPMFKNGTKDTLLDRCEKLKKRVTITEQMIEKADEESELVFSAKMKLSLLLEMDLTAAKEGVDDAKTYGQLHEFGGQFADSESSTLREWADLIDYWSKVRNYALCKDDSALEMFKSEAIAELQRIGSKYLENGPVAAHMLNLLGVVYKLKKKEAIAFYEQYSELFKTSDSDENYDRSLRADGFIDQIKQNAAN